MTSQLLKSLKLKSMVVGNTALANMTAWTSMGKQLHKLPSHQSLGEPQLRKGNEWTKCQENCKAEVWDTARWPATHHLSSLHKFFQVIQKYTNFNTQNQYTYLKHPISPATMPMLQRLHNLQIQVNIYLVSNGQTTWTWPWTWPLLTY